MEPYYSLFCHSYLTRFAKCAKNTIYTVYATVNNLQCFQHQAAFIPSKLCCDCD